MLWLNNNEISAIGDKTFSGLFRLEILGLHQNKLNNLGPSIFADLRSLLNILLDNNMFTEVPPGVIGLQMPRLQNMYVLKILCACVLSSSDANSPRFAFVAVFVGNGLKREQSFKN